MKSDLLVMAADNAIFDQIMTNVLSTNTMPGLLMADFYANNLNTNSDILFLKVLYAGGQNRIKSNPIVNLFTDGPRYAYAGGAAVSYVLIDNGGNVVLAGTARDFSGFKKLKNSKDFTIHNNLKTESLKR